MQPISEVNLIYQDKGEMPLPGHATIYRTVSSQFNADTNKGSHGRTIYATYKRASLMDDDVRATCPPHDSARWKIASNTPSKLTVR